VYARGGAWVVSEESRRKDRVREREKERKKEGCQDWLFQLHIVHLLSGKTWNVVAGE